MLDILCAVSFRLRWTIKARLLTVNVPPPNSRCVASTRTLGSSRTMTKDFVKLILKVHGAECGQQELCSSSCLFVHNHYNQMNSVTKFKYSAKVNGGA